MTPSIQGSVDPLQIELTGTLAEALASQDPLDVNRKGNQRKLYALRQYVKTDEDRRGFNDPIQFLPIQAFTSSTTCMIPFI